MEIKNIMDPNLIKIGLAAATKKEVLAELTSALLDNDYISNSEGFIQDIYKRESEGQTGIGNYIAIPHAKSTFVKKIGVAIGISKNEIPWESHDGKGAKVIILFAVGDDNEDAQSHLKLLSLFARKLGNDEVVANLLQAQTQEDVISAFI